MIPRRWFEIPSRYQKLAITTSSSLFVLAVAVSSSGFAQTSGTAGESGVVIDPAFGGKDHGPIIEQHYFSKTFTLEMGRSINEEIRKTGVTAKLTRSDDVSFPYDEILLRTGGIGIRPRAYVVVSVGGTPANCLHILHPERRGKTSAANKAELGDVIRAVTEDQYWTDGTNLAEAIRTQLKTQSPKTCVRVISRGSYAASESVNLLPSLFIAPVVIIEFGKELAKTLKTNSSDKDRGSISSGVAMGVVNYLRASEQESTRKPKTK